LHRVGYGTYMTYRTYKTDRAQELVADESAGEDEDDSDLEGRYALAINWRSTNGKMPPCW
jgi:hypothetical protein